MVKIHWNNHFARCLKRTQPYTEINPQVSKATEFSSINMVAYLMQRETQKPFYTQSGTINTAMHGGLLYILLHPREYSGMYFTGISASQIHLSCTHTFCNVERNKVPLSD